jgi:uncharacterized glyoxalase superfamily protein PhnB
MVVGGPVPNTAMEPMESVEPDEATPAAMDDEVTAAETTVKGVTASMADAAEAMTASVAAAMTTTVTASMATTMPTAAGIRDLRQADDGGNKQS